jgi:LAO/AO transport system kinase
MAKDLENEARRRAVRRIRNAKAGLSSEMKAWSERIQAGDRVALAKGISLIESHRKEDRGPSEALLSALSSATGKSLKYGFTGVPGVGKSTWIEAAGMALIEKGHRVAVLAVDPSSRRTGGSMLGDKTRMAALSQQPSAFVRPSPTGDTLGGVARATSESVLLCEAAGFDRILIETVGVGQSETEVRRMSDDFVLLMLPGGGDGVQGIKRGILEWADVVLMNKADGPKERIELAKSSLSAYQGALSLLPPPLDGAPPVFGTGSALDPTSVAVWVDRIETRLESATESGQLASRRRRQQQDMLNAMLKTEVLLRTQNKPGFEAAWQRLQKEAEHQQTIPFDAIRRMLDGLN